MPKINLYGSRKLNLPDELAFVNNCTENTNISEITNIVLETDLAIVVDSGPLHMFSLQNIPCIVFMGGRLPIINWSPLQATNYYIYDDELECLGCKRRICPKEVNECVNSNKNLMAFNKLLNFDSE